MSLNNFLKTQLEYNIESAKRMLDASFDTVSRKQCKLKQNIAVNSCEA